MVKTNGDQDMIKKCFCESVSLLSAAAAVCVCWKRREIVVRG